MVGYFTTLLKNTKKRGGNCVRDPMWEYMEYIISDWDLFNVKPPKGKFT
jgi:hypothetical protein